MKKSSCLCILYALVLIAFHRGYTQQTSASLNAQSISPEIISPAGGYYINGNSVLSWTLGEPAVETYSNANAQLTQGFQQPYYIITNITENKNTQILINVFPNPLSEWLNISITGDAASHVKAELFDATGKLILQKSIPSLATSNPFSLYVGKLPVASYLLKVSIPEKNVYNAYKIQKLL